MKPTTNETEKHEDARTLDDAVRSTAARLGLPEEIVRERGITITTITDAKPAIEDARLRLQSCLEEVDLLSRYVRDSESDHQLAGMLARTVRRMADAIDDLQRIEDAS